MINYLKIGGAVVLVAAVLVGIGFVQHWRSEAAKVPGLETEIATLRGQLDSTNFSLEECEESVRTQNALVESYLAKANEAERAVVEAAAEARRIDQVWRQRWAGLPPPLPDCCGAMGWLYTNAPRGWTID